MPSNKALFREIETFISEQTKLLSDMERRIQSGGDMSSAANFLAKAIPRTKSYLEELRLTDELSRGLSENLIPSWLENLFITEDTSDILSDETSEQLKLQLVELQTRITDVFIPFIKEDQKRRTALNEFIVKMGGTDESVSIQFPARLNYAERLSFVNEQLKTITGYLKLNTTNEALQSKLHIIRNKLQQEKRLLEAPEAEQAQLREQLQTAEAALRAQREKAPSPSSVADRGSPEIIDRTHETKEERLKRMGVSAEAMARGNIFGGIAGGAGLLKKVKKDPVDEAIEKAKEQGQDLITAALAAAEKAKTDPAVAVGKAAKEAELKHIAIIYKVIEFLEQQEPDITEKKLMLSTTQVAEEIGFDSLLAQIMVKQAIRERRQQMGEYNEVTGAQKPHEANLQTHKLSEFEQRLKQQKMKVELKEDRPNADESKGKDLDPPSLPK